MHNCVAKGPNTCQVSKHALMKTAKKIGKKPRPVKKLTLPKPTIRRIDTTPKLNNTAKKVRKKPVDQPKKAILKSVTLPTQLPKVNIPVPELKPHP